MGEWIFLPELLLINWLGRARYAGTRSRFRGFDCLGFRSLSMVHRHLKSTDADSPVGALISSLRPDD